MTAIAISYESLLKVRKGAVDIVDVPEFGFVAVTGTGEPGGAEFTEAVQALYSVSYGAHFRLKKLTGQAPRVMPLEGLWWVDDPAQQDIVAAVARGEVTIAGSDRGSWRWQALIMQPDPVDAELIAAATAEAASKKDLRGCGGHGMPGSPGRCGWRRRSWPGWADGRNERRGQGSSGTWSPPSTRRAPALGSNPAPHPATSACQACRTGPFAVVLTPPGPRAALRP